MKIKSLKCPIFHIIEEGLIADFEFAEGRLIPAVVLKNNNGDKSLEDFIKIHQDTPPGDAKSTWTKPLNIFERGKYWDLHLDFSKPQEFEMVIRFNLLKEYRIIDAIIISRGLYLSYGEKGDKISQMKNGFIVIEIPNSGADEIWEKEMKDIVSKKIRKRFKQKTKKEIEELVRHDISEYRKLLNVEKS